MKKFLSILAHQLILFRAFVIMKKTADGVRKCESNSVSRTYTQTKKYRHGRPLYVVKWLFSRGSCTM